jgi:uncharacterized Zn-binding protein involved in type VI secretion
MGSKVACVGDIGAGVCPVRGPYVVILATGDSTFEIDGRQACHVGSIGAASCGHPTVALTGGMATINDSQLHRIGDVGVCSAGGPYVVTTGSILESD